MRAVADELGAEAMSLYHHVPGKEALLDGLVEKVMDEVRDETRDVAGGDDWRATVREHCLGARRVMLRHPWAPQLMGSRSSIPPSVFGHYEAVLAAMVHAGFSYALGHRAVHALGSMVLGFTQELFAPADGAEDLSQDELARLAEELPHITAMVASEMHAHEGESLGWCDSQAEFEFTLDLLLDGLEAQRLASEPGRS